MRARARGVCGCAGRVVLPSLPNTRRKLMMCGVWLLFLIDAVPRRACHLPCRW